MKPQNFQQAIIVANGSITHGAALDQIIQKAKAGIPVVSADGGANATQQLGLQPTLVIGDMDSIQSETLSQLEQQGIEIIRFKAEKDETDLELAMLEVARRDAQWVRIIGAIGSRIDQTISNIQLLTLRELVHADVRIVDGKQTVWLANPGTHPLDSEIGDTVSLIPMSGNVTDILTSGMAYSLNHETLYFGPARGISNVISAKDASITFQSGLLLIIHTIGKPD